ncbi:C2H2 type zinc-finger-domain-containing protein [Cokeromyces recurvatus]|uniref:C2H2 type zinc-finger-domain-containing protein n=1 Tax=Cokeromyces recurvatus TaxID=90255 RepID=UPI00222007FA|nr:C2H2 type zinc-finger-domain-containing protein [Cokeromyces recurvatus]KAI7902484.1 C2H2 type zinc-finger-domain-containing protein [Cokeromyces recurvatus]
MYKLHSEHVHQAQRANPLMPRNNLFTCLACQVAFQTTERQRAHYRTDWHKYNLKRKIAQLSPVTAEQFAQKVLAQQTKGKEEEERRGLIYECMICRKSYSSENAFSNHLLSKKHKDLEFNAVNKPLPSPIVTHKKEMTLFSDTDEDVTDTDSVLSSTIDPHLYHNRCLFCNMNNGDFETNLEHMSLVHGFFLPDVEYLEDAPGLILYLAEKIDDCICLYCNGRGKEYKSQDAVRRHMLDKGHCKMAYDESENPNDLLRFYNFGTMSEEDFEAAIVDPVANQDDELILQSGERIGHRRFMRYYKQKIRKLEHQQQDMLSITQQEEPLEKNTFEPRNRKERRSGHRLAITDGLSSNQTENNMLRRLPEFIQKQHYQRQSSKRDNLVVTSRMRNQTPI